MSNFIIMFLAALAALVLWDFITHFGEFCRGLRSGWGKSRMGPKPTEPCRPVTVNNIVSGSRLSTQNLDAALRSFRGH